MIIGRKFAFWTISIVLASSAVTAYFIYALEIRDAAVKFDLLGKMTGRVIEESIITFMQRRDNDGLNRKLDDIKANTETINRILLLNRSGVVKAGTDKGLIGTSVPLDAGRPPRDRGRWEFRLSEKNDYRWGAPVINKTSCHACHSPSAANNGTLIIDFSLLVFRRHVREQILTGFIIIAVSMITIGVVMVILSKVLITRRLERMAAAMTDFREGRAPVRAPVEGRDEITQLETSLNEMADAITAREEEKDALSRTINEQLRFLQQLIDTIPMPVFYKDTAGVYRGCNRAFEEFLGLSREKLIGRTVYDIAPKELADEYHRKDRELFDKPGIQRYEFFVRHAEGTRHSVIFNKATYADARGNVAGLLGVVQDITERKRMEDALKQTNETLRAIIHASPLAVVSFDVNGIVGIWNPAAERIFGWREEEVQGRFNPLVTDENKNEFLGLLKRVLLDEPLMGVELRRRRKDGSPIDVSVSSAPIRNAKNDVVGMMSLINDITERRKAEQLIQRNYDIQTAINWILNISLKDIPLDGVLQQALDVILSIPGLSFESKGALFLLENDPDRLIMKAHRGLSEPQREACNNVPIGKCLCGRAAARGEVQFSGAVDDRHELRYDGIAPHGHYCVPIRSANSVLGVINIYIAEGHGRDEKEIEFLNALSSALAGIIQRKRLEQEREKLIDDLRSALNTISRSYKEWQDTFDSITDLIAILDKDCNILKANRAFAAYFGHHPRDVIYRKCYEFFHEDREPIPNCPHRTTMAEKRQMSEEVFDKKTNKVLRITTFPYSSPDGETIGSIHVARDITDEKDQEMRLILSERLAALGQMASGIAHEINNPLASIAGCSEGLLSRVRKGQCDTRLFETYLNIIQEEVFRCKSITTAMLSFVRKTTYEKKDVNINEMIDKTMEVIGFQGRLKDVEVGRRFQEQMPLIHGNEGELRQVLLAVITNALDAMGDAGVLTLATEASETTAVVRITDTGPGISPEILTRIFDPFFTTKSEKGGTGLGLSIARKIIANHGGNIDVASDMGRGATFIITLPR